VASGLEKGVKKKQVLLPKEKKLFWGAHRGKISSSRSRGWKGFLPPLRAMMSKRAFPRPLGGALLKEHEVKGGRVKPLHFEISKKRGTPRGGSSQTPTVTPADRRKGSRGAERVFGKSRLIGGGEDLRQTPQGGNYLHVLPERVDRRKVLWGAAWGDNQRNKETVWHFACREITLQRTTLQ